MSKIVFKIPYPKSAAGKRQWSREYGLNAIYAGKHWAKRQKDSQYWHYLVREQMQNYNIPKIPFNKPVRIIFYWNSRLDLDNEAYKRKLIIDALKGWIIHDDSKKYIKELVDKITNEDCIIIEIEEV
nr:MAG TPA: crossover junction endodeoxyribonuclease [Caudoviricetes sp.]